MSTFENDLRLEEIGTGERSGTWGTATNTNLELIANALSYSATGEAIANASSHTITMQDGVADEVRSLYLKCTGGGQACTVTLAPNTLSKVWMIENTTSATLTFSQGSGANVAILAGQVKVIGTDGAGSGAAVFDLMQDLAVPDLFVDDDLTLQSDAAVLGFGADKDVTLTHVADTGLLLNAAMKVQFRDAAIFIGSSGADVLDIASDGVINLTATSDVVIPTNVGLHFTDANEKIESDGTDLTINSGRKINLTPAASGDVHIPVNIGLVFGDGGEHIETNNTNLTITSGGNVVVAATTLDVNGDLDVSGTITLGSGAVISEAELELLDGLTPGTAIASKVVTTDANIDTTGQRNLTITGELDAATGDFSGAVDIAGDLTLSAGADGALNFSAASSVKVLDNNAAALVFEEADNAYMTFVTTNSSEAVKFDKALDINAAVQLDSTLTVGVDDTGYDVKFFGATSGKSLLWDESADSLIVTGTTTLVGTTNLDVVDIDGAVQLDATLTVGANDQGYDVILYGDTASANMTWDTSADDLIFNGAAGLIVPDGQFTLGSTAVSSTAAELNLLDGSIANSVVNSKAVIYGSSGEVAGTLSTAAQTNITSLGTLTALTVDDVGINGKAITMTGSSSDTAVFTVGTNGTLSITTTDDAAAAANITITADGTFEAVGTTITLDSGGTIELEGNTNVTGDLDVSGQATATGFTGTLDGVLGSGTAAAATVTTLDTSGAVNLNLTTDSTSSTSGALIVDGGVGIAKKLFVGTDLDVDGTTNLDAVDIDGAVDMASTLAVTGIATFTDDIIIGDGKTIGSASDVDAMSISSGGVVNFSARPTFAASLTIQDGGSLGSASDLNAMTISSGGVVAVTATTASSSPTTGALTVGGGLGVAADLFVGDDFDVAGDAVIDLTCLVTGVLTTTAAAVFNGGFAAGGVGTFADGSAGAPSITNTGDLDTGILFPAADTVGISAGGTEALRIDANLNMALGTDGTLTNSAGFSTLTLNGSTGGQIAFHTGNAAKQYIYSSSTDLNIYNSAAGNLRFYTNGNNERMTIDSAGRVSIGRTSDVTAKCLELQPPAQITDFLSYILNIGGDEADDAVGARSGIGFGYTSASRTAAGATIGYETKNVGGGTFGDLYFATRATVGTEQPTERMVITSAGDVTVTTGNLVIGTAGKGIDFSAQTPTSATGASQTSELLDHYEEGTFTGTIFGASTAGTYETSAATGNYTRIGNVVTCMFQIVLAGSVTGGGSGNMHFSGFPFPYDASLNTGDTSMCNVQGVDFNTSAVQLSLVRQSGADTNVFVIVETFHNAAQQVVQAGEFAANDTIRSTVTYLTLT